MPLKRSLPLWFAFYSALAVAATWPLALHVSSKLLMDLGDPLLSTTILWWNAHALPLTSRWWDGFSFAPGAGTLSFSDHRLGASLIASPLQWLGCSPITAYNVTLMATFPLCAIAAHWLAFTVTRGHGAALLCGLAFGFNPYRVAHIEHLELLTAFAMPVALAALHLYADTRRFRWIVVLTLALILQGLCGSYYFLFFGVFVALWLFWFVRWSDWRLLLSVGAACVACAAVLSPIAIEYWSIHRHYGMTRSLAEIISFSGDVTSMVTGSDRLVIWGWTGGLNGLERQLFPGLTISALALAGGLIALRGHRTTRAASYRWSGGLAGFACLLAAYPVCLALTGRWPFGIPGVTLSVGLPIKMFSLAVAATAGAVAMLPQIRQACQRRSVLAFYLIATIVLFVCSLGPKPSFLDAQILHEAPYAWLMRLPVFSDGVRVPGRFAMLAVLALSVAGALAFSRLRLSAKARPIALAAIACAIVADGWMGRVPLVTPPAVSPLPDGGRSGVVLELPLGDIARDVAAMYLATGHGHRVVNGNSGYTPGYYPVLKRALEAHDVTVLDELGGVEPLLIAVSRRGDAGEVWLPLLMTQAGATALQADATRAYFAYARRSSWNAAPCSDTPLAIRAAFGSRGPVDLPALTDGNPRTWWEVPRPQRAGDAFTLDLGQSDQACAITLQMGRYVDGYPRLLRVDTSVDGIAWTQAFSGPTGGLTLRGALADPQRAPLRIPLASTMARFVRVTMLEDGVGPSWLLTGVIVSGPQKRGVR